LLVEHQHATSDPATTSLVAGSDAALKAKRPADAERLARIAIGRDPKYVPARLALGRALEALGRHAEAASVYADAARVSPFSPGVSKSLRNAWAAPLAGFGVVAFLVWTVFRVIQRQFDQRTVLGGLLICTVVLIVGTLVLLQRRRRRFASLSEEDRKLLEAHGAGGMLASPGSGRLLLVGAVIVVLSGAVVVFALGTKASLQMQVGDCFTLDRETSIEQVSTISCDLPHSTEIYAVVVDPAPFDAPFPGIDAVRAGAKAGCDAAYVTFIGAPYTRKSTFWINVLSPEEPYWAVGIRTNFCTVHERRNEQTSGSARGSGG
jgi:hypothetical protein